MPLTIAQAESLRRKRVGESGNRVAAAVKMQKGLTKSGLAREIDLPITYVHDVCRGRWQTISVDNARKFAEYFGVHIEDLFPAREAVAS